MAYWWVSQNKTFGQERKGGYIWAPLKDKAGRTPQHWRTVAQVKTGDTIFSYVRGHIVAVGEATSDAEMSAKPADFDADDSWENNGRRVRVRYTDLRIPVDVASIATALAEHLPQRHAPLNRNLTGVQGYLFALPDAAGRFLQGVIEP